MGVFRDLMQKRRSIRDYEEREVPLELIKEIIADSCEAPSASNAQPWSFIIITNKEMMKRLSDDSKKNILHDMNNIRSPFLRLYRPVLKNENFNVFYNAPCLIYIIGPKDSMSVTVDCTLAASYFMFSAAEKGLGTCWVDFGSNIKDAILLDDIGLLDDYKIVATIILGYPKTQPARPPRSKPKIIRIVE